MIILFYVNGTSVVVTHTFKEAIVHEYLSPESYLCTVYSVDQHINCLSHSCIMYLSDLSDMYTQARGPLGPREWVYISSKSQGHVIQLICTMWSI